MFLNEEGGETICNNFWSGKIYTLHSEIQFQCYLGPSLRDWRTINTFQCSSDSFPHWPRISVCVQNCQNYIVLQSGAEGHEKAYDYGTDLGQSFRTFSPQLENNDAMKCSFDSFAHTLRYVVNVETWWNYNWNVSMSSNCGEKVLNSIEIWWTQDLIVKHIYIKESQGKTSKHYVALRTGIGKPL